MEFKGKVTGGVVVPEQGVSLPEGADVRIEIVEQPQTTLSERLMKLAGTARGLPPDMARNHDHYLHGRPKQ